MTSLALRDPERRPAPTAALGPPRDLRPLLADTWQALREVIAAVSLARAVDELARRRRHRAQRRPDDLIIDMDAERMVLADALRRGRFLTAPRSACGTHAVATPEIRARVAQLATRCDRALAGRVRALAADPNLTEARLVALLFSGGWERVDALAEAGVAFARSPRREPLVEITPDSFGDSHHRALAVAVVSGVLAPELLQPEARGYRWGLLDEPPPPADDLAQAIATVAVLARRRRALAVVGEALTALRHPGSEVHRLAATLREAADILEGRA